MSEYRIVKDLHLGHEVQVRRWWHYPFWFQCWTLGMTCNSFVLLEDAEEFAHKHAKGLKDPDKVIKYLGVLKK